jgi:Raf kinase inhibitor-like YbhB/YbcL family protein
MQRNVIRIVMILTLIFVVAASMAIAQGGGAPGGGAPAAGAQGGGAPGGGGRGAGGGGGQRGGRGGGIVAMPVSSTAFPDGGDIPAKFITATGVSPELTWAAPPAGTMSFVLIMHDLDAQTGNTIGSDITHWVVWNIPGTATKLAENVATGATLPDGSHQANNIAGSAKYFGPSPPAGAAYHHYIFQLYALNAMLDLPATATRADVEKAMDGKIVARGAYTGKVKG